MCHDQCCNVRQSQTFFFPIAVNFHTSELTSKVYQSVAVVLASGSMLAFNPRFVTGVCCCAEEGQESTLFPQPLRSHRGKSWADGERKRCRLHRLTFGAAGSESIYVDSYMHHNPKETHAQAYTIATLHSHISWATQRVKDAAEQGTPAR